MKSWSNRCARVFPNRCGRLVELPVATNGMALGLCGAASVLLEPKNGFDASFCLLNIYITHISYIYIYSLFF